uniref:F-box domain-containing protein n=1 Tax=Oryza barthii TaxID=65489 RepID=A0A0D3F4C3_9ORYZ
MSEASKEDAIEALPDEILHHILSYLPADEAMMTCILSRRWHNLWKSTSVLLIIDMQQWKS